MNIKWVQPVWLWFCLTVPFLIFLFNWDDQKRVRVFQQNFIHSSLWSRIVPHWLPRARFWRSILWGVGLTLLFIALARPQFGTREEVVQATGLDVVFVLDVSQSMLVQDIFPNRLEKAKHWIQNFSRQLSGDRVGLVVFAGDSLLACPLTTDLEYIKSVLERISTDYVPVPGTDFAAGLEAAVQALQRGAEDERALQGEKTNDPPTNAILLISDGEDHEGQASLAVGHLKEKGIHFYVLGIGTEKGGPIPLSDSSGNALGFKKDSNGNPIISPFHPEFLMKLAQEASGKYWNITSKEKEVEDILKELGALNRTAYAERRYPVFEERFQIPLFFALLCFLGECAIALRASRKKSVGILS